LSTSTRQAQHRLSRQVAKPSLRINCLLSRAWVEVECWTSENRVGFNQRIPALDIVLGKLIHTPILPEALRTAIEQRVILPRERKRRANGLGISGGAPIDREDGRANSIFQNSDDLAGAERRPLHARVGRQSRIALHLKGE